MNKHQRKAKAVNQSNQTIEERINSYKHNFTNLIVHDLFRVALGGQVMVGVLQAEGISGNSSGLEDYLLSDNPIVKYTAAIVAVGAIAYSLFNMHQLKKRMINVPDEKRKIVNDGLYNYTRNPIYLGYRVSGIATIIAKPTMVAIYATSIAFLFEELNVHFEEKQLEHIYGKEYNAYKQKVPRWIPKMHHIKEGIQTLGRNITTYASNARTSLMTNETVQAFTNSVAKYF